jgi:cbb3-type cytochrome c oxidase subunit III
VIRGLGALGALLLLIGGGVALAQGEATGTTAVERGAAIYGEFCSSCHGRYGRGDGPLAADLTRRPPDFTDSAWLGGRSDAQIVKGLTSNPHTPMAIASLFDEATLTDAVAYIRRLSVPGKHVSVLQGRDIYQATCWACHGRNGDGRGPASSDLQEPRPRDFTSPDFVIEGREKEIAKTIKLGAKASFHGSSFMPAWGSQLSDQQIQDLIEYLKTFKTR